MKMIHFDGARALSPETCEVTWHIGDSYARQVAQLSRLDVDSVERRKLIAAFIVREFLDHGLDFGRAWTAKHISHIHMEHFGKDKWKGTHDVYKLRVTFDLPLASLKRTPYNDKAKQTTH